MISQAGLVHEDRLAQALIRLSYNPGLRLRLRTSLGPKLNQLLSQTDQLLARIVSEVRFLNRCWLPINKVRSAAPQP